MARAVHFNSRRKHQAFITINCGAIPKDLLESELFGYTRGAFTGAVGPKRGKVEAADGGTLFLDEIGEMPLELQVKLLRLIQNGEIEKVGVTAPTKVDVRIIAATHRNLQAQIEDGAFREDLYYRLAVIPLELPPLRDRAEDIPELVEQLFLRARAKHGLPKLKLPAALLPIFQRLPLAEAMFANWKTSSSAWWCSPWATRSSSATCRNRCGGARPRATRFSSNCRKTGISLENVERELLLRALRKFDWNQTQAARYLDISRRAMIYRMEKFNLRREGTE